MEALRQQEIFTYQAELSPNTKEFNLWSDNLHTIYLYEQFGVLKPVSWFQKWTSLFFRVITRWSQRSLNVSQIGTTKQPWIDLTPAQTELSCQDYKVRWFRASQCFLMTESVRYYRDSEWIWSRTVVLFVDEKPTQTTSWGAHQTVPPPHFIITS